LPWRIATRENNSTKSRITKSQLQSPRTNSLTKSQCHVWSINLGENQRAIENRQSKDRDITGYRAQDGDKHGRKPGIKSRVIEGKAVPVSYKTPFIV
jgi:hypothetical protein